MWMKKNLVIFVRKIEKEHLDQSIKQKNAKI